jgi:hypothetical protein
VLEAALAARHKFVAEPGEELVPRRHAGRRVGCSLMVALTVTLSPAGEQRLVGALHDCA